MYIFRTEKLRKKMENSAKILLNLNGVKQKNKN